MAVIVLAVLFLAYVLVREYIVYKQTREAEDRHADDRAYLLQRIQAPREVAYKEFAESLPPGADPTPIWTDEEAWTALDGLKPRAE